MKPLRVCIDARVTPGAYGGVEQYVFGLAHGLVKLDSASEEYVFLVDDASEEWVRTHVSTDVQVLRVAAEPAAPEVRGHRVKERLRTLSPALFERLRSLPAPSWMPGFRPDSPAASDGAIERAGIDLMHFTMQQAFLTDIPSIYQPHDLQHLHLRQIFGTRTVAAREARYPVFCRRAAMVAVVSSWVKRDLIQQYRLPAENIAVIPYAPVVSEYPDPEPRDIENTRRTFNLPARFVFYPAQTYRHKNHIGLIEALARLRDEGLIVPLVSSGKCNDFFPVIERTVKRLGMAGQAQFLGFVTPMQLQCLYRMARATVIPTRFEAASFPMWEAFLAGVPVACSNVTSLPEQAGDAALIFDPADIAAMADAVRRLWTDDDLCRTLIARGRTNVARFTWERTARLFRAHYRRIGGRALSAEDRVLIDAPPLL